MIGVSRDWTPARPEALAEFTPGAVILFARNVRDRGQVQELTAALRERGPLPPLLAIDHEGGRINRLRDIAGVTAFPPAAELAELDEAEDLLEDQGRRTAAELLALGVDLALAPVVDVLTSRRSTSIGNRAYGSEPEKVGRLAGAFIRGAESAGLICCAKHFPGYGAVNVDPHDAPARAELDEAEWRRVHLPPFAAAVAAGVSSLMTAHVALPALDPTERPATLSPPILARVRAELGFAGALLTDDLEMGAITARHEVPEAAVASLAAGADLVLICHRPERQLAAHRAIVAAVDDGRLPEARLREAAGRVAALRG